MDSPHAFWVAYEDLSSPQMLPFKTMSERSWRFICNDVVRAPNIPPA